MKNKSSATLYGPELVALIVTAAQDKLAEKIVSLDLSGMATAADFFVICQSDTTVQNRAIAEAIIDRCAEAGANPWHSEGKEDGRWVLIDFSDVVVHILLPDLRKYYDLESLWSRGVRREPGR